MNKKHLTVADLERYFVNKVAQGVSDEKLFTEFASIVGARFVKFNNRNPDAFGVLTDANNSVNIFYDASRGVYGFQALCDGNLQAVLPLKNGCEIVDLFMRLAANIGKFAEQSTSTNSQHTNSKNKKRMESDDESDSSYRSDPSDSSDDYDSRYSGSDDDDESEYESDD